MFKLEMTINLFCHCAGLECLERASAMISEIKMFSFKQNTVTKYSLQEMKREITDLCTRLQCIFSNAPTGFVRSIQPILQRHGIIINRSDENECRATKEFQAPELLIDIEMYCDATHAALAILCNSHADGVEISNRAGTVICNDSTLEALLENHGNSSKPLHITATFDKQYKLAVQHFLDFYPGEKETVVPFGVSLLYVASHCGLLDIVKVVTHL